MRKANYLLAVVAALLFMSCGGDGKEKIPTGNGGNGDADKVDYKARAKEIYDIVNPLYAITSGSYAGLYREELGGAEKSYIWPFDGWVSAVTELNNLGFDVNYTSVIANAQRYATSGVGYPAPVPAYGSAATAGPNGTGTRFYDDNSIIGTNFVEAYRATGDPVFLTYCKNIVAFLKTGEDDHLGGAMWWNEGQKNPNGAGDDYNKPTCSNGFGTCFLLDYYSVCPEDEKADVLAFATRLYDWLYNNLRDPSDNTYWNAKHASGTIQTRKWTYNSGVMIKNGLRLYHITGQQRYLDHAKATAVGAFNEFVRLNTGIGMLAYPNHDPWFNTKLLTAYIELVPYMAQAKSYINTYIDFIDYGYKNCRTSEKLFYEGWAGDKGRYTSLLMQACVVESYGAIARYKLSQE